MRTWMMGLGAKLRAKLTLKTKFEKKGRNNAGYFIFPPILSSRMEEGPGDRAPGGAGSRWMLRSYCDISY